MPASPAHVLRAELQSWLCGFLAEELKLSRDAIDPGTPMTDYGLDSVAALSVLAEAEERVGFEIEPDALWEFPTVAAFTESLVGRMVAAHATVSGDGPP